MTQARRTNVYIVNVDNIPLETALPGETKFDNVQLETAPAGAADLVYNVNEVARPTGAANFVDNLHEVARPTGAPLAPILSTLTALVVAMENTTTPSPAATAYSRAIRRKADELVQAGGPEALAHAVAFIREQAPAKADQREAIIIEAWAGLAGWRS